MEQEVKVTILGTAQDAGIPQAGCSCERCLNAHNHLNLRKYPVSIGIEGIDGSKHLIETGGKQNKRRNFIWNALFRI